MARVSLKPNNVLSNCVKLCENIRGCKFSYFGQMGTYSINVIIFTDQSLCCFLRYMVDAADHEKLEASRNELHNLLDKPQLNGIPVSLLMK